MGVVRKEVHSSLPKRIKIVTEGRIGVFLDRDGTLNEEVDYVRTPEQLRMIDGAAASVRTLNELGVVTCVISNQSGIARGYLSEKDLEAVHIKLKDELERYGARLDAIYYCPHHPAAGREPYNIECDCRKPRPGMLHRGEREFGLNLSRSFVVGDSIVDIQAGDAVGATTVLVLTGYGQTSFEASKEINLGIGKVAKNITEAVEFIAQSIKEKTKTT